MVPEVFERMTKELTASAPSAMKIKVVAPPDDIILTVGAKTLPLRGSVIPSYVSVGRKYHSNSSSQQCTQRQHAGIYASVARKYTRLRPCDEENIVLTRRSGQVLQDLRYSSPPLSVITPAV